MPLTPLFCLLCLTVTCAAPEPAVGRHQPPPHVVFQYGASPAADQHASRSGLVHSFASPLQPPVRRYSVGGGLMRRHGADENGEHGEHSEHGEYDRHDEHGRHGEHDEYERPARRPGRRRRPSEDRRKSTGSAATSSEYAVLDYMEDLIRKYRHLGCANMWRGDRRASTMERCAAAAAAAAYLQQLQHQPRRPADPGSAGRAAVVPPVPAAPLVGRQARHLNWTIWADYMEPYLLNHRLGADVSTSSRPAGETSDWVPNIGPSPAPTGVTGAGSGGSLAAGHPAGHAVTAQPEPFVPPHLRDDFPYKIRVISSKRVNLAPPAVNGVPMQPGPLSQRDSSREVLRSRPPASRRRVGSSAAPGMPVLAAAALATAAVLVVTATASSDGGRLNSIFNTSRDLQGGSALSSDGLLLLRSVEAAITEPETGCQRRRLCRMAQSDSWQPLQTLLSAAAAWFAEDSDNAGARTANLMAVATGAWSHDCDQYPQC